MALNHFKQWTSLWCLSLIHIKFCHTGHFSFDWYFCIWKHSFLWPCGVECLSTKPFKVAGKTLKPSAVMKEVSLSLFWPSLSIFQSFWVFRDASKKQTVLSSELSKRHLSNSLFMSKSLQWSFEGFSVFFAFVTLALLYCLVKIVMNLDSQQTHTFR